jgi:hypothetical protein
MERDMSEVGTSEFITLRIKTKKRKKKRELNLHNI